MGGGLTYVGTSMQGLMLLDTCRELSQLTSIPRACGSRQNDCVMCESVYVCYVSMCVRVSVCICVLCEHVCVYLASCVQVIATRAVNTPQPTAASNSNTQLSYTNICIQPSQQYC